MKRLFLSCLTLIIIPYAAHAANINEEGAQTLKTSFQAFLDYQQTVNKAFGGIDLVYEGELTVAQEATFYTITFPHILIKELDQSQDSAGEVFDVGVITINAMPDEKSGYWKTVMTIPSKMTLSNGDQNDFTAQFAQQRNIGLFSDRLGYFTKMDMNISDVSFSMKEKETGVSIGGLQLYTNMDESADAKFSGTGHISISNLVIAPPEDEETIKFGELKFNFSIKDAVMPPLKEYQDIILKHTQTFETLQNIGSDNPEVQQASGQDIMNMVYDLYNFDIDGFSFGYSTKDMEAISPQPEKSFSLKSANLNFGLEGLKSETGTLLVSSEYEDIKSTKLEKDFGQTFPSKGNLNLKAINIPYPALSQIAQSTASAVAQNPESGQMVALGTLMRLPAVLGQAETKVIIEQNGISNDIYDLSINGTVETDLTSIAGFSAKLNALFEGMDELIAAIQPTNDETENSPTAKIADALGKWKAIGTNATGPNGKPAYSFDIETSPTGQVLINGQDASTALR